MKKYALFAVFCFVIAALSSAQNKFIVIPENPRPGEPITIGTNADIKEALLFVNGKQLAKSAFFAVPVENEKQKVMAAVITIPSTAGHGDAVLWLRNEASVTYIPISIAPRDFVSEVIKLDPVNTGIRTDASPRRTEESNLLWTILSSTGNRVYHTGRFITPVTSTRRTSFFGDRRVFQYSNGASDTSIHAGVDIGVPTGTRVVACGSGRIVLARERIVTGFTVIIEHAPGVYSLYYHLDSINVVENAVVETGSLIGLSGSTGLSTGPHLHWELRVSAENTDPDIYVTRPIIDKDLIISKLYDEGP